MTPHRRRADRSAPDELRFVEEMWDGDGRGEVVGSWALRPVGTRPRLGAYLRALAQRRHFIWADSRARALSGNRGYLLGNAWLVLGPLLDGLTYYLVFGLLLQTSRGIENFIGYLLVGVFLFHYTSRSVSGGAHALSNGRNMIRGFSFPRAALPISAVIRELVGMVPVLLTLAVMVLAVPPHAEVSWRWLLFPAVLALQTLFNLGLALLTARIAAHLPDIRKVVGFVMRLWLYGSAVMYSFDRFIEHPDLLRILQANPMFIVLDISRDLLLYAVTPAAGSWLQLAAWAAGTMAAGLVLFWHGEELYGRG